LGEEKNPADAVATREFGLLHFDLPSNGSYVDRLRRDLLQLDFAALVRQDQFHSFDQVRSGGWFGSGLLWHVIALPSDMQSAHRQTRAREIERLTVAR
jgi:hypothetical protein